MALYGRREISAPEPRFEFRPPGVEDLLGLVVEPDVRDLSLLVRARAEVVGVEAREPLEDVVRPVLGARVLRVQSSRTMGRLVLENQKRFSLVRAKVGLWEPGFKERRELERKRQTATFDSGRWWPPHRLFTQVRGTEILGSSP